MKDDEFRQIFIEEANSILDNINSHLEKWQSSFDMHLLAPILRDLHTLKGSARMIGLIPFSEYVHVLEQLISKIHQEKYVSDDILKEIQNAIDYLVFYIDSLGKSVQVETFPIDLLRSCLNTSLPLLQSEKHSEKNIQTGKFVASGTSEFIRINFQELEKFSVLAGEVNVSRAHLSQKLAKTQETVSEMTKEIQLLQEQIKYLQLKADTSSDTAQWTQRSAEFDEIELETYSFWQQSTRSLIDKLNYIEQLNFDVGNATRGFDGLLRRQSRAARTLEEKITHARMITLASLVPRLSRIVRQVSRELGKDVKFNCLKAQGEVDRKIFESLIPGLEHMVRNAIDHGIESSFVRKQKGKPEQGIITLSMFRQSNELIIELSDDGQGIDIPKIKEKAIEKKLWDDRSMSMKDALQMILLPGFSTKTTLTPISGSGLGMDVVNTEISKLGGTLKIATKSQEGASFIIRLPCGLSLSQALILMVNKQTCAIALEHLSGITRLNIVEIKERLEAGGLIEYAHKTYHLSFLSQLLGMSIQDSPRHIALPILLLQSEMGSFAFVIDKLIASREIMIKPAGLQLQFVKAIAGFSVLSEGQIVLVLNVKDLIERALEKMQNPKDEVKKKEIEKERDKRTFKVLIVDDSITVRQVMSRFLKRHFCEPFTAVDGLDALEKMANELPDIVLLDVEMPRMDGYQVVKQMKEDPRYKNIPIIMITSRAGQKHQQRGIEAGVDGYLIKPFLEKDLLHLLNKYKPHGE